MAPAGGPPAERHARHEREIEDTYAVFQYFDPACPECRTIAARYQALGQAIRAWGPPPSPTLGFTERVLAALSERQRRGVTA